MWSQADIRGQTRELMSHHPNVAIVVTANILATRLHCVSWHWCCSTTHPNTVGTISAVCWQVMFYIDCLQSSPSVKFQIGDVDQENTSDASSISTAVEGSLTTETLLAFDMNKPGDLSIVWPCLRLALAAYDPAMLGTGGGWRRRGMNGWM